jgi:hypothetical protein
MAKTASSNAESIQILFNSLPDAVLLLSKQVQTEVPQLRF